LSTCRKAVQQIHNKSTTLRQVVQLVAQQIEQVELGYTGYQLAAHSLSDCSMFIQ
jgi:hypothetical protein